MTRAGCSRDALGDVSALSYSDAPRSRTRRRTALRRGRDARDARRRSTPSLAMATSSLLVVGDEVDGEHGGAEELSEQLLQVAEDAAHAARRVELRRRRRRGSRGSRARSRPRRSGVDSSSVAASCAAVRLARSCFSRSSSSIFRSRSRMASSLARCARSLPVLRLEIADASRSRSFSLSSSSVNWAPFRKNCWMNASRSFFKSSRRTIAGRRAPFCIPSLSGGSPARSR